MKTNINLLRLMSPNRTQIRDRVHRRRLRRVLADMRIPWVCYSTPNLTLNPSSVKGVVTGAPQSQNFHTSPFFPLFLAPTVDSIRSFAHAAGFAAARRCLRSIVCFIYASQGRALWQVIAILALAERWGRLAYRACVLSLLQSADAIAV